MFPYMDYIFYAIIAFGIWYLVIANIRHARYLKTLNAEEMKDIEQKSRYYGELW